MFRDVQECSGMFHVPDFIDGQLDITKTNIKYNNYSGIPFEDSVPESYQGRPQLLETF